MIGPIFYLRVRRKRNNDTVAQATRRIPRRAAPGLTAKSFEGLTADPALPT